MAPNQNPEAAINQGADVSRFGVFGDFPTRAMLWGLETFPRMPFWIEAAFLYFFTTVVFLLAHEQRRAVGNNLAIILTELSWAERQVGVFRVFANFGWTYIDGLRTRLGQDVVTWEAEGMHVFETICASKKGAILLTTHTGNYDLAAAMFSSKFERDLHTVRAPEHSPMLQEIRRRELLRDVERYEHFKVHYNSKESLLGIELASLLADDQLVAIQGDRVVNDVVAMHVPIARPDTAIRLPKGPMVLAVIARCPCYPVHVVRTRHRHYRILFQEPLEVPEKRPRDGDLARAWAACLMPFLEAHACEWFVFEDAFVRS